MRHLYAYFHIPLFVSLHIQIFEVLYDSRIGKLIVYISHFNFFFANFSVGFNFLLLAWTLEDITHIRGVFGKYVDKFNTIRMKYTRQMKFCINKHQLLNIR